MVKSVQKPTISDKSDMAKTTKTTKKERKPKKEKTGPKRPLNAYMCFNIETRPTIVKENPTMQASAIFKELGKLWQQMSDADKAPFVEKSKADKKRYEREIEALGDSVTTKK